MKKSLGLIETQGLAAGIEAADAAVKSANVRLIGYELTKGGGWTTIKVQGDVGAVKAAVDAARMAAAKVNQVVSTRVIPRPSAGLDMLVYSPDTVGTAQPSKGPDKPKPPTPPKGSKKVKEEEKLPAEQDGQEEVQTVLEQTDEINEQEKLSVSEMIADHSEEAGSDSAEAPEETGEKEKAPVSEEPAEDSRESEPDDVKAPAEEPEEVPVPEEPADSPKEEEKAQEPEHPETEEGEVTSEQETPEPAASKPAKRTASKGRKGGKRGSKPENAD